MLSNSEKSAPEFDWVFPIYFFFFKFFNYRKHQLYFSLVLLKKPCLGLLIVYNKSFTGGMELSTSMTVDVFVEVE